MEIALYTFAAYLVTGNIILVVALQSRPKPTWNVAVACVALWPLCVYWYARGHS